MKALLVINKGGSKDLKVLVRLESKALIAQVNRLVGQAREKEAFDLLLSKAQVEDFIPPGRRVAVKPDLTFIEDIL